MRKIIISLGGSVYYPDEFREDYIKEFGKVISSYPDIQFFIVCGGGANARRRMKEFEGSLEERDYAGISAVNENAKNVLEILNNFSNFYDNVIIDMDKLKNISGNAIIGAKEPGHSTDWVAVKVAEVVFADEVINVSDIDYVYDKNPKEFSDAKKLERLSWSKFFDIIGHDFVPGGHYPFDPVASKVAMDNDISVIIINGNELERLDSYIKGNLIGTLIRG